MADGSKASHTNQEAGPAFVRLALSCGRWNGVVEVRCDGFEATNMKKIIPWILKYYPAVLKHVWPGNPL